MIRPRHSLPGRKGNIVADLVAAYALSHSSLMISQREMVPAETAEACFAAMATVREHLENVDPDVMIVVGTDHFNTFSLDMLPPWCIGRGATFDGYADNMPFYRVVGRPDLSERLLHGLYERGFEPAFSDEMKLDHSFLGPLHFITPAMDVPVVPIFQNSLASPFPAATRSFELGAAIRSVIESMESDARFVIIGTGGLSHWIGGPEHGRLNAEFDRRFLDRFAAGDVDFLTGLTEQAINTELGNGGQEIRNWLTVRGCAQDFDVNVVYYEEIRGWLVGAAVTMLVPAGR
jgi:aromatic ring-opening dioxygenase catalytic subunit (LigB family)